MPVRNPAIGIQILLSERPPGLSNPWFGTGLIPAGSCRILDVGEALKLGVIDAHCQAGEALEECLDNFIAPLLARNAAALRGYKALRNSARNGVTQRLRELETDLFVPRWLHDGHWRAVAAVLNRKR